MQLSAVVLTVALLLQGGGLIKKDLVVGTGDVAKTGDRVLVDCVGTFPDGKPFYSTKDKGEKALDITLGKHQVIEGWEQGLVGMKAGGKRKLTIPPELAYGAGGAGDVIPPNATLVFVVDMLQVNGKAAPPAASAKKAVAKKPVSKKHHSKKKGGH